MNPAERPFIIEEALAKATAISGESARARALTALAPHLPPDFLDQALATATAISGESARAEALTAWPRTCLQTCWTRHWLPPLRSAASLPVRRR